MRKVYLFFLSFLIIFISESCLLWAEEVVVYVSEDQVFSQPILKDFEKDTGIHVKALFDTEETKGTGVMNRLIAEKNNPRADVYWANEPIRAEVLKIKGISTPYFSPVAKGIPSQFKDPEGYWTGFSARARVLLIQDRLAPFPDSIMDYTKPEWRGKGVMANPLFGTTSVHMAVLFEIWGDEKAKEFLNQTKENQIKISTNNGESADLVALGEYAFALVDSDDAINRIRMGKKVRMIIPDQGSGETGVLILPNAALLIKSGPNPENGKKLIDYLLSPSTEEKLAIADCAQIPLQAFAKPPSEVPSIHGLKTISVDFGKAGEKLQSIQKDLKKWLES